MDLILLILVIVLVALGCSWVYRQPPDRILPFFKGLIYFVCGAACLFLVLRAFNITIPNLLHQ